MKLERLPDGELDIMKELWREGRALKASEIAKLLAPKHSWKVPTVHVLLSRLSEKGFVEADRSGYSHKFSALVSENDYFAAESANLAKKTGGKLHAMFAALIDSADITDEELSELSALLDAKMKEIKKAKNAEEKKD